MASRLTGRTATLIVDDLAIKGLRVQFKVEKTLKPQPNNSEIQVYNLSKNSRARMASGAAVQLQAGAQGNEAVIYSGRAHFVDHVFDGPECVTKLECTDGSVELDMPVAESFGPGTTVGNLVKVITKVTGMKPGNSSEKIKELTKSFNNGYTLKGKAGRLLNVVLASAGYTFSIQDGQLQILSKGEASQATVYKLSHETGLIGSPQHGPPPKKAGEPHLLKVRALLLPQVLPGRLIYLDSLEQKGLFRIEKMTHVGDTHADEWTTHMEVGATS